MRSSVVFSALSILLFSTLASSMPIQYRATYEITSFIGPAFPTPQWGDANVGSPLVMDFIWDTANAEYLPFPDLWSPTPFSYVLRFGNARMSGFGLFMTRAAGSTRMSIHDETPLMCAGPDPCTGFWHVDNADYSFECADWASAPRLLSNFACGGTLQSRMGFETTFIGPEDGGMQLRASLRDIKELPAPSTIALLAAGLFAVFAFKRRETAKIASAD